MTTQAKLIAGLEQFGEFMSQEQRDLMAQHIAAAKRPAMNPSAPAKPWIVLRMSRAKNDTFHPWHIQGENHYYMPTEPEFRFSWQCKVDDERFDLSRAVVEG